jgi:hypothetical protein
MAKDLPKMWDKIQIADYTLRDQYYIEFKNFEQQIIHVINLN